ncbi:MAG: bis(5'-nucleosyl)-tetraphosphatase (symmetrical) YqeK [Vampirovibrionales bacterium]|nr:bis(5'-nucleosyl)-tetraphosphatase (symmetrical) YqeK [Vampirovibrionales bacterium]
MAYTHLKDNVLAWAESVLSRHRFAHVRGVYATVVELASSYGFQTLSMRQAAIAAIVHDIAREYRFDRLIHEAKRLKVEVSAWDLNIPMVLHARIAPALLAERFQVHDPVIAEAMWDHTTAHSEMSEVGKLLYVADKLEGVTRDPLWREPGWQIATDGKPDALNRALLWCLEESIAMLQQSNKPIHPDTLMAQQAICEQLKAFQGVTKVMSDNNVLYPHF